MGCKLGQSFGPLAGRQYGWRTPMQQTTHMQHTTARELANTVNVCIADKARHSQWVVECWMKLWHLLLIAAIAVPVLLQRNVPSKPCTQGKSRTPTQKETNKQTNQNQRKSKQNGNAPKRTTKVNGIQCAEQTCKGIIGLTKQYAYRGLRAKNPSHRYPGSKSRSFRTFP
eukprot:6477245-Amphidinium_carterae.1